MSITFCMVIIRVTLSKTTSQGGVRPSSSGSGHLTFSRMSRINREREYRMKRMEVHITQLTETNEREEYGSGRSEPKKDKETEGEVDTAAKVLGSFAV
ncbi:hypothetical protein J3R83DRAFT_7911 [Lanmaoa asiatica]|nr:hypothetical protein J3R83DRAFT_7911 [Lanmaoa asiatica]